MESQSTCKKSTYATCNSMYIEVALHLSKSKLLVVLITLSVDSKYISALGITTF